ncbi:MAG: ChbG/HpnK family deacetylase [Solirubrobacterales bacterium]|nr:ChbG/HpnK family deacetylase [Solirubrobacterales bacterium]
MTLTVIFNADDFGVAPGINRGIVHCHESGVLTSTSLMVHGRAAEQAAQLARRHPLLAVGLHWDLDGKRAAAVDFDDGEAVRAELERQLALAERLLGHPPTHLDSHHHVHLHHEIAAAAREIAERTALPLRGSSEVRYIGGFYAQWEPGVDDLEHVSVAALTSILATELGDGWTEIGCHPGFVDADFHSAYREPREAELATLTNPALPQLLEDLGLRLASFAEVRSDHCS